MTVNFNNKIFPLTICLLSAVLLAGIGCGKAPQTKVEAAKTDANAGAPQSALPGRITGKGWHIPWRVVDPKHPHGPLITVLIADAEDGVMTKQADNIVIQLSKVHAQLFQQGKHAADVQAHEITTDEHSRVVTGTGGVKITSITDPPDTIITADRMSWNTHTSKVIASGHAHYVQYKRNGGLPDEVISERLIYDLSAHQLTN